MIRINLLPVREAEKKRSGRKQLIFFALILLVEVGVLLFYQSEQQSKFDRIKKQNDSVQVKIDKIQRETKEVGKLRRQTKELEAQQAVLDRLIEGQSGPVKMLDELSRMLTHIDEPKLKVSVGARGWNPDWEPKRLWINAFEERDRAVQLSGHTRSLEDLAEFLGRLESSRHFVKASLKMSEVVEMGAVKKAKLVKFDIETMVIYGPADVKRLASGKLGVGKKKKKH